MKLATIRVGDRTSAVRVDGDSLVELGHPDVGALLAAGALESASTRDGASHRADGVDYATLLPQPGKVVCVGLNYRHHIQEMGRELPAHPTLFAKYPEALIGARDPIVRPAETHELDWEAELGVVIGTTVRRADDTEAAAAIAGFTIVNDVTCRDWQYRTLQWLQGKTWESTTPVGPWLVTPDEVGGVHPSLALRLAVDGAVMQQDNTGDLVFDPVALVRYISTIIRLNPGDLIATGTPGGVGHARSPAVYLTGGEVVVTEIEGLGRLENRVVAEAV